MQCKGLFAHSMDKLETVEVTIDYIVKVCPNCEYRQLLPRSKKNILFLNNKVMQHKRTASEDNAKELLQPLNEHGDINEDFTEAYGFNPFDERTKVATPTVQGGLAK